MHYAMDTMNPVVTFFQSVEGTLLSAEHGVDRQLAYIPTQRIVSTHPNLAKLAQKTVVLGQSASCVTNYGLSSLNNKYIWSN